MLGRLSGDIRNDERIATSLATERSEGVASCNPSEE